MPPGSSSQNDLEKAIRVTQALLGKTPPLQDLSLLWQPRNAVPSRQRLSKSVMNQQENDIQKQSTCVQHVEQPLTLASNCATTQGNTVNQKLCVHIAKRSSIESSTRLDMSAHAG
jgi:hypothetical protein